MTIEFKPMRAVDFDMYRATAICRDADSYRGSEAIYVRGTCIAYTSGRAIAHVHSGRALEEFKRFGPEGGYQEVGFAACFIDY